MLDKPDKLDKRDYGLVRRKASRAASMTAWQPHDC